MLRVILAGLAVAFGATSAAAFPVGERHLTGTEPSAALRDAGGSDQLRITVWYPAAAGAVEAPLDVGPPGAPLFKPGSAAPDAAFADDQPRPVVLLSHGFGGTARIMAWFGTALARDGYVVIAVDHPGNNARDTMTVAGATMFWARPGDLATALARVEGDPLFAPHLDRRRLGAAGFSAGGFTALATAGGRVDLAGFRAFCTANPTDGVCAPQKEFPVTLRQRDDFMGRPGMAAEQAHAGGDLRIPGVSSVFVMAPAIVQAFDPASLRRLCLPVGIILGDADPIAPPATNGETAARLIPGAQLKILPDVGHYDFLADCTPVGDAVVRVCPTRAPREPTHRAAIADAVEFFGRTLRPPASPTAAATCSGVRKPS